VVVPRKLVPQSCRTQWSQFNWSWHMNAWEEEGKPFIFGMEKERKLCSIGMQMILIDKKPSHFHFRPPRPRTIFIHTQRKKLPIKMIFFLCDQILSCKMWRSTSNSTWWEKSAKILWQQYSTAAQQCIWKYFHKYFECYPFFLKEWISKDRRDCYYWNGMIVVAILEVVWLATVTGIWNCFHLFLQSKVPIFQDLFCPYG